MSKAGLNSITLLPNAQYYVFDANGSAVNGGDLRLSEHWIIH